MIASPTLRRSIYPLLAIGLVICWTITRLDTLDGVVARNAGFLSVNRAQSGIEPITQSTSDLTRHGIAYLEKALRRIPNDTSMWRVLGYQHLALGQEGEALTAWSHLNAMGAELLANGVKAEEESHFEEALTWYRRAATVDPQLVEAWLAIGQLHEARDEWAEAEAVYESGTSTVSGTGSSDLYFRLARARTHFPKPTDYQLVLKATGEAMRLDRFTYDYHRVQNRYLHGVALRALGRESEALNDFEWVVAQRPDDYWAYVQLGELILKLHNDETRAEQLFKTALDIRQDDKWAYLDLARLYDDAGRTAEANALYRVVLQLDPSDPTASARLHQP